MKSKVLKRCNKSLGMGVAALSLVGLGACSVLPGHGVFSPNDAQKGGPAQTAVVLAAQGGQKIKSNASVLAQGAGATVGYIAARNAGGLVQAGATIAGFLVGGELSKKEEQGCLYVLKKNYSKISILEPGKCRYMPGDNVILTKINGHNEIIPDQRYESSPSI